MFKCHVCENTENNSAIKVKEMMFGYGDDFDYFECSNCGCLQITEIPPNLSKYYPFTYYSIMKNSKSRAVTFKDKLLNMFFWHFSNLLYQFHPLLLFFPDYADKIGTFQAIHGVNVTKNSKILDVGCGSGELLFFLKNLGFRNLMGCDPNIKEDIYIGNKLAILKGTITQIAGKWDLIIFNQSFEHMSNQNEILLFVNNLLNRNGKCLINMPTTSSFAWKYYKSNWVQLDAPRHLYIHSLKSIKMLAKKAELNIDEIVFNSSAFQFWGSEQYIRGIPLNSKYSYCKKGTLNAYSIFSTRQISQFEKRAINLNMKMQGDNAVFYLSIKD